MTIAEKEREGEGGRSVHNLIWSGLEKFLNQIVKIVWQNLKPFTLTKLIELKIMVCFSMVYDVDL